MIDLQAPVDEHDQRNIRPCVATDVQHGLYYVFTQSSLTSVYTYYILSFRLNIYSRWK